MSLPPFHSLLSPIRQRMEESPSQVVLESRQGAFTWSDVAQEWALAKAAFEAIQSPRRAAVCGERDAAWLGAWLAALDTQTPWLMISDELAVGMCRLLEKTWQANLRWADRGDGSLFESPADPSDLVFVAGESRSVALKGVSQQDWQARQAVWEAWLANTPVGRVGWWLPIQNADTVEAALYHLSRGSVLSCPMRETKGNRWMRGEGASRPRLSLRGLTHLHLTALQAMNTRWEDASSTLKAWVHGPCPDWVLKLHPGLARACLPPPSVPVVASPLDSEGRQLLEVFQQGMADIDPDRAKRLDIEKHIGRMEGVAACAWLLGPKNKRYLMVWVAPDYDRAWVGAQIQQQIRAVFDTQEWDWRFLSFEGLSTHPDGQQNLGDVMYWLFDTD